MAIKTVTPTPSQFNSTNLVQQAKSKKSRRKLLDLQPKTIENVKSLLAIKGNKTNELINSCLADFVLLHKPYSKQLQRHNNVHPFEDAHTLEFLGQRNDSSLLAFGQHSKKKPNTIVLCRLFDYTVYDMLELQIDPTSYISIDEFNVLKKRNATVRVGSVPLLLFHGDLWANNEKLQQTRPVLIDYYHGETVEKINLSAIDHIIVCTALLSANGQPTVAIRHYGILMKKSGSKYPRVELDEIGPRINYIVKQYREPDTEQHQFAMQTVKSLKSTLPKNIEAGTLNNKLGRIHVENQAIDTMALFKQKGLKKRGRQDAEMTDEQIQAAADRADDEDYDNIPQSINKVIKRKIADSQ